MVIATLIHVLEFLVQAIIALRSRALKEEAFDLFAAFNVYLLFAVHFARVSVQHTTVSAAYGVPSLSITSPNTRTLPGPKMRFSDLIERHAILRCSLA